MPTPVLHHYPHSPFAEKVRLVLGFKGLAWRSCEQPDVMPGAHLQALTGGHRRVPLLQIGADIYCDASLIVDVLDNLRPKPSLYPQDLPQGLVRSLAQWADGALLGAAMSHNFTAVATLLASDAKKETSSGPNLNSDRQQMLAGNAACSRSTDAVFAYRAHLRSLDSMLLHSFLLGPQPCLADFACYAPLWFTRERVPQLADIFAATPALLPWMDRVASYGHSLHSPISTQDALRLAAAREPQPVHEWPFVDGHGLALGSRVRVQAEGAGHDVSEGELVAATADRVVLRCQHAQTGIVHVHFPRLGFALQAVGA